MIRLDGNLIDELDLKSLSVSQKNALLHAMYAELELRVGTRLAAAMTYAQLGEFERLIDSGNEAASLEWLESNIPNYRDVAANEFENLVSEARLFRTEIQSASVAFKSPSA